MSRLPNQMAFNPNLEQSVPFNATGQVGVHGVPAAKATAGVGVQAGPLPKPGNVDIGNPAPAPGMGAVTGLARSVGAGGMKWIGDTIHGAMNPAGRPSAPKVTAPRSATSVPNAPAGDGKGSNPVQSPSSQADALNAFHNQQGYGPNSTESQVSAARGQRIAGQADGSLYKPPGVAPTPGTGTAVGARPGVQAPVAVHRGPNNVAYQGGPNPVVSHPAQPDPARAAIVEQLKYHQEMARLSRNSGGGFVNGSDGGAWGESVLRHADALARYDHFNAQTAATDPSSLLAAQQRQFADPQTRAAYEGANQMAPGTIPPPQSPGLPAFNATNYESAGQANPHTRDASAILADTSIPIHQKAAMFASMPGVDQPDSPHRQLWDAFMARQHSRGPEFSQELGQYNPGNPGQPAYDTSNPVAALGSIFSAAKNGIFGVDPAIPSRNSKFSQDMGRLGYAPARVGIPNPGQELLSRQVGLRGGQSE